MVAVAGRLFPPGPALREVWVTFGLSVLFHAVLTVAIVMMPRFQVGTYIRIPVSYTVSLVDAPPGGGRSGAPSAALRPAPVAAPPVPAAAARPAPVPRLAPTEELTLPSPPTARKPAPPPQKPSVRPPSVSAKETTRPVVPTPAPMAPVAPVTPVVPVVPAVPTPVPPMVSGTTEAAKTSGVEVAGTGTGAASGTGAGGGSAIASYLTLVDWKIQQNWVPVGPGASAETVVVIRFRVLRSGQVRDLELETSSGIASLDASALRAVRQSLPLPPFPNLLTEPSLDLRYRFVMERG